MKKRGIISNKANLVFVSNFKKTIPSPKTAQTTIFIILAILIVTIIVIFIFVRSLSQKENLGREYFESQGLQPSINNIQNFIVDCLEITSKDALVRIGIQGGYNNKPDFYFDMQWAFIPYYYYQGSFLMPTKLTIQKELSSYVDENIESCLNDINFQNFQLRYSQPKTKATIKPSSLTFNTNLPVIIEHEGNTINFDLNQHPVTLNSSLSEILEITDFITESHKQDPNMICINCVAELAKERNLYVDFIAFQEDTTLVMILENRTMEEPYLFEFLNKYNLE